ncbi:membrane protein-like protein [Methanocorpusculum labreanum Z]|uniref:Membrane protein-like protein n=1 Tax=Methanocorpusculum labreanum (strain ATCC 43576 / DSM 4855 / Z) TaxID=410358 RepID=A2SQL7_METLZ|nr:archaeosortase A [Methanocorpusculum labreanum]ABN06623.1 membrane protein-like protein [Methanocorpusculum labreanum Z]
MLDTLILCTLIISLVAFLLTLIPGKYDKYTAITGWIMVELSFLFMLPDLLEEGNFFYPLLAIAGIPLVYITIKRLLIRDQHILRLTYAAAICGIVYAPFAIFTGLGNRLISIVVFCIRKVFDIISFPYIMADWNIFESVWTVPGQTYGYMDQIILGCTGITAIAILLGVIALTKTSLAQKIGLTLLVCVPIFIINIFRNVFVIMAYFGQWFPWFEEELTHPTIPGYASFFWSHNVICEGAAFLLILVIAYLLFRFSPGLISNIREILFIYRDDIRLMLGKKPRT